MASLESKSPILIFSYIPTKDSIGNLFIQYSLSSGNIMCNPDNISNICLAMILLFSTGDSDDEGTCCFTLVGECRKPKEDLTSSSEARTKSIISSSKQLDDTLHIEIEKTISKGEGFKYHRSCVSTYTSKTKIKNKLAKRGISETSKCSSSEPPTTR